MKQFVLLLISVMGLLTGCGRKEITAAVHKETSRTGAFYKSGKGVTLTDEMRQILGVEVADVTERKWSNEHPFTVQVFGETHHSATSPGDHSACDARGSGLVSAQTADILRPGQVVQVRKGTNAVLSGVITAKLAASPSQESEIVIGVPNAATLFQPGDFIAANLTCSSNTEFAGIPQSSLLRTVEGNFVYAVNGSAYFRTPVKVGGISDGWVEILDGLLPGDQVVTKGVEGLWLIELRATNAGDACTH